MQDASLGLYIHIPFCLQKCLYCDFCSFPARPAEEHSAYVRALCREIEAAARALSHYTVNTVFIGGGTPSLLSAEEYSLISNAIQRNYRLSDDLEFTSEANPATLDMAKLQAMKEAGINRLSIGLQSSNADELSALSELSKLTGVEIPKPLAHLTDKKILHTEVIDKSEMENATLDFAKA